MTIQKALTFLSQQQQKSGAFLHQTWNNEQRVEHSSPFFTAVTVRLLSPYADSPTAKKILDSAEQFLRQQLSSVSSANYWTRGSEESKLRPYPDDLDTTSCILIALHHVAPDSISGEMLAQLVNIFSYNETAEGGPYRTWLVGEKAPEYFLDVDVTVNANCLALWGRWDVSLPATAAFLNKQLTSKLSSPYYVGTYPILFFLSFVADQLDREVWLTHITKELQTHPPQSIFEKALCSLAILQSKTTELFQHPVVQDALQWQPQTFEAFAIVHEPLLNKEPGSAGSASLTAALWLALQKFQQPEPSPIKSQKNQFEKIMTDVKHILHAQIVRMPEPIQSQAEDQLNAAQKDGSFPMLAAFPLTATQSFSQKDIAAIPSDLLTQLGCATVYGWFAYTLYDNIWDSDEMPIRLGLANIWSRLMTRQSQHFQTMYPQLGDYPMTVLDGIDAANTWEFLHCRFAPKKQFDLTAQLPDFDDCSILAQRAFGHGLGPLIACVAAGHTPQSAEFKIFESFWRSYLIAKQLNDDAHDWEKDLSAGRHTPVTVQLLDTYRKQYPHKQQVAFSALIKSLRKLYWKSEILTVVALVQTFLDDATAQAQALEKHDISAKHLSQFLLPLQGAMDKARKEHSQSEQFLRHL